MPGITPQDFGGTRGISSFIPHLLDSTDPLAREIEATIRPPVPGREYDVLGPSMLQECLPGVIPARTFEISVLSGRKDLPFPGKAGTGSSAGKGGSSGSPRFVSRGEVEPSFA